VPIKVGVWPAFWLLGEDSYYGWPYCGEIDIMEGPVIANTARAIHAGTHSPTATTAADISVAPPKNPVTGLSDDFHTYAVDWSRDKLEYYVDHKFTGAVTRAMVESAGGVWQFNNKPQSIILNLAVGGWAGTPDSTWTEQSMLVDYVRVYE